MGQGDPWVPGALFTHPISSEPLATLGSGKLCTGIVLFTFFVLTHVDGVATKEGEGRVSEPWASQVQVHMGLG